MVSNSALGGFSKSFVTAVIFPELGWSSELGNVSVVSCKLFSAFRVVLGLPQMMSGISEKRRFGQAFSGLQPAFNVGVIIGPILWWILQTSQQLSRPLRPGSHQMVPERIWWMRN